MADLHCEKRDRAIETAGIREAHAILRELNEYLEDVEELTVNTECLELYGECHREQQPGVAEATGDGPLLFREETRRGHGCPARIK